MFDFHMHSKVSFDGHDTGAQMANAAAKAGLKEICFTDHMDLAPLEKVQTMRFDMDAYHAAYDGLEVPGVKIRRGMEFGLLPDNQQMFRQELQRYPFDFVIGSIHFVDGMDPYFAPYWVGKSLEQAEYRFMEGTLESVRVHEDYDVLGHLTYISKTRCNPVKRPVAYETYREMVDEILKILVSRGKGLEVNTSGLERCGVFLPAEEYVRRFRELGGQIVTVGSDAHTSDRVGAHCAEACEMLKEIFGYVCTFEERKPIFHKL